MEVLSEINNPSTIGDGGGGGGSTPPVYSDAEASLERFRAAKTAIQANCAGCHFPGGSSVSLLYDTENEYIERGLVTAGNLERSKLIYRLQNFPGDSAAKNMPPTGPLSTTQYDAIRLWVLGMPGAVSGNQNFFTCNPNEEPDTLDAKRLSKVQIYNSLHGILSRAFGASQATSRLSSSSSFFTDRVPNDSKAPYSRSDANFDYLHAKAYFDIADELATWIVDSSRYATFVNTYIRYNQGSCSYSNPQTLDATCRTVFLRNFLLRTWGRPVEETNANNNNELSAYLAEFQQAGSNTTNWVNNVVFRALTSPSFLMTVNPDITIESGDIYRLSDYALARRLSLNFMQSGLDEDLLTIVQNSSLTRAQKFSAILEYTSSRSEGTMRDFADEWLKLYKMPTNIANQSHAKFQRIASGVNLADANLIPAMRTEIQDLVAYLNKNSRPATEILTSNISFAQNANLRMIYGQTSSSPAWNNVTESNAVRFPASERAGILTRAGHLLSGSYTERLIMRGVHVRDQILCLDLGVSPPNAATTPLPTTDNMTTREKYEVTTSGASCVGCHSQINPAGFALSEYNSLGGFQTQEPIFNANGDFVRLLPVDKNVNLLTVTGDSKNASGGVEYSRELATSRDFKRCMSQTFYSYFHRLPERTRAQNSCTMQSMYQVIEGGGTLNDFIKATAQNPRFQLRKLVK